MRLKKGQQSVAVPRTCCGSVFGSKNLLQQHINHDHNHAPIRSLPVPITPTDEQILAHERRLGNIAAHDVLAYHEASHAVAYTVLGFEVNSIVINVRVVRGRECTDRFGPECEWGIVGATTLLKDLSIPDSDILADFVAGVFAGSVGETKYTKLPSRGLGSDMNRLSSLFKDLETSDNDIAIFKDRGRKKAHDLLEKPSVSAAIEELAQELILMGKATGSLVREVVDKHSTD